MPSTRALFSALYPAAAAALCPAAAAPADGPRGPQPDDLLGVLPADQPLPRHMTPAERLWAALHPQPAPEADSPPPTGPIHCPGEYEPADGIITTWREAYPNGWYTILAAMGRHITTTGDADLYVVANSTNILNIAMGQLTSAGANMGRVKSLTRTMDSIWVRDYGPRYIYEGDCRAIVDHVYNRPQRVNDNTLPVAFAALKRHARYDIPLVHGGGNFHLSSLGDAHTTRLIVNENPNLTEQAIHDLWRDYQNVDTIFYTPYPTTVDLTQHIDMWMQVTGDRSVVISDWPSNPGTIQETICNQAAASMAAAGYTVARVPARSIAGTHYTYTNVVMCNGIVMIPSYTHAQVVGHNAAALAAWQSHLPGKQIIPIDSQSIVDYAGVLHCIVMHVPEARGNGSPTAYLRAPNGGEVLSPGSVYPIRWISDDDKATTTVDLLLSTDGGATFPATIAAGLADTGAYNWAVPDLYASRARVRVVVRDADSNTGGDASDANFLIDGCYADCDQSTGVGQLDIFDFLCFQNRYDLGDPDACDCDTSTGGGVCDVFDFLCFQNAFAAGCP